MLVRESVAWYNRNDTDDGLIISPLMKQATEQHLAQNDFVSEFISENYILVPSASVKAKDFIDELKSAFPRECSRFKRADLIKIIEKIDGITYGEGRGHTRIFKGIGKLGEPTQEDIKFDEKPASEEKLPFDENDLPFDD